MFCFQSRAARPSSAPLRTPRLQRLVRFVPERFPTHLCCPIRSNEIHAELRQTLSRRERVVRAGAGWYFIAGCEQPSPGSRLCGRSPRWAQQGPHPPGLGDESCPSPAVTTGSAPPPAPAGARLEQDAQVAPRPRLSGGPGQLFAIYFSCPMRRGPAGAGSTGPRRRGGRQSWAAPARPDPSVRQRNPGRSADLVQNSAVR